MPNTELLMPAGNIEKMKYAIAYGADAVYLGTVDFSLRNPKKGDIITNENIASAIETAHKMGVKAYVTLNVFANNEIIEKLPALFEMLQSAKPDGIIFADAGFYQPLKEKLPDVPLHISTQANIMNYEAVKFWRDQGISRIILARELSLKEIEQISAKVPDVELEVLVHGSLCVSYSGRCFLSDYLTSNQRKANLGNCTQPCRWQYKLTEQKNPDNEYEIIEDEKGTYIFNPKDIALIRHIPDLINAGVHSFKVEGRTKSIYYVSLVAKTYRSAIDAFYAGKSFNEEELFDELLNAGNRGFTEGFLLEKPNSGHYDYFSGKNKSKSAFMGMITEKVCSNLYKIQTKNQIKLNDTLDWITPDEKISSEITEMFDLNGDKIEIANTNDEIMIQLDEPLNNWQWGLIRCRENSDAKTETNLYSGAPN